MYNIESIDEICSLNHSGFQFLFVIIFSILIHLLTFGILTSLKRPRQFQCVTTIAKGEHKF